MLIGSFEEDIEANLKFRLTKSQLVLLGLIILVLISLGYTTTSSSRHAISQAQILTQTESTSSSIIFTQREALVYTTRFSQWIAGSLIRREVQIARALLTQRLSVVDQSGTNMGDRATPEFIAALVKSDKLVAAAPPGFLPRNLASKYNAESALITSEIIDQARQLIVAYQHDLDKQFRNGAVDRADAARLNLIMLYLLVMLTSIFIIWVLVYYVKKYKLVKEAIRNEKVTLWIARDELIDARTQLTALRDLDAAKNEFISTINHELRTPLTSIVGYVDFLRSTNPGTNKVNFDKIVLSLESNATALLDLVESILSLTRLDSQIIAEENQDQNLATILDNVLVMLSVQAEKKSITVHQNIDPNEKFLAPGNRTQISQVFVNLISNAIKFSEVGSEVQVELKRIIYPNLSVHIELSVSDKGMGIPKEDTELIFTRFFRAKNASEEHIQGTGLGLAIVKKTMDLHNGSVSVVSVEGEGSTFTVDFPGSNTEVEKMVDEQRLEVLGRAIRNLEDSSPENLAAVSHSMGGAIAFYTFEEEGAQLEEFSVILKEGNNLSVDQIESKRLHLIHNLELRRAELTRVKADENE